MIADKPVAPDPSAFSPAVLESRDTNCDSPTTDIDSVSCLGQLTHAFCSVLGFVRRAACCSGEMESDESHYSVPTHPHIVPASTFPMWTPAELESLISRWTCTYPGPPTHPQNVEIASLITLIDSSSATLTDAAILHASLLHRLRMDHNIETLAYEIGLTWLTPDYSSDHCSTATFAPGVLGIEDFEPPPGRPLTTEARRLLLGCRGEWKEAVMPLPKDGVRMRYRKPKYWVVSVAAVCGWSSEELDDRMEMWFEERGEEGLFE